MTGPYLWLGGEEIEKEIAAHLGRAEIPEGGYRAASARAGDPLQRSRWLGLWRALEDSLTPKRRDRYEAREGQAVRARATGLFEFLAGAHAVAPEQVLLDFTRGAVEVMDDTVAAAGRERSRRFGGLAPGSEDLAAAVPALSSLADHDGLFPAKALVPILRQLGGRLGLDPEVSLPRLLLGSRRGPGGLVRALGGFGRSARATFLSRLRGRDDLEGCDVAFGEAAEVLFRRLVLSTRFGSWSGLSPEGNWLADLRFEEAVGHRLAWTYLVLASEGVVGPTGRTAKLFERATGRPATPDQVGRTWDLDPEGAAVLRGTVLGLLLEERLMTRFGKLWFMDRGAGRFLREFWEGERGETAESMAATLELGRIEPTPIVDLYRL